MTDRTADRAACAHREPPLCDPPPHATAAGDYAPAGSEGNARRVRRVTRPSQATRPTNNRCSPSSERSRETACGPGDRLWFSHWGAEEVLVRAWKSTRSDRPVGDPCWVSGPG